LEKLPPKRVTKLRREVVNMVDGAKVINDQECKHQEKWTARVGKTLENTGRQYKRVTSQFIQITGTPQFCLQAAPESSSVYITVIALYQAITWRNGKRLPGTINLKGDGTKWCISHICSNKACINPEHVVVETVQENNWRTVCQYKRRCCGHANGLNCLFVDEESSSE